MGRRNSNECTQFSFKGYLWKRGTLLKSWKRYWFVTDADQISYYRSQDDDMAGIDPLGSCTVSSAFSMPNTPCGVIVSTTVDTQLFLKAESDLDKELLLQTLETTHAVQLSMGGSVPLLNDAGIQEKMIDLAMSDFDTSCCCMSDTTRMLLAFMLFSVGYTAAAWVVVHDLRSQDEEVFLQRLFIGKAISLMSPLLLGGFRCMILSCTDGRAVLALLYIVSFAATIATTHLTGRALPSLIALGVEGLIGGCFSMTFHRGIREELARVVLGGCCCCAGRRYYGKECADDFDSDIYYLMDSNF